MSVRGSEGLWPGPSQDQHSAGGHSVLPGVILSSSGAAMDVAPYAAELSGSPVLPLSASSEKIREIAQNNPTAFVLADPSAIRATDFPWFLQTLTARGIRFGTLFVTDPEHGRGMCRKMLRRGPLPASGDAFVLVDAEERHGVDRLWPIVQSHVPFNLAERSVDVIVFSGHSGPLDARAGTAAILCGRADADGYGGRGVFSCYHDGLCFRQIQRGRVDNPLPTLPPSAVNASVVVIAGCGTVTLGRSLFSAAHNLVHLLLLGSPAAVIACSGVTFKVTELDLLCLTWITGGVPLGEVVRRLNAISCERLGQNGGLPPGVGPFILFGNPCLRFESKSSSDARAAATALPAELKMPVESSHRAIPISRDDARRPLSIAVQGSTPCRFFFDEDQSTLHLWKATGEPAELRVEAGPDDPYRHHRTPIERAARNVSFWLSYLGSCVETAIGAGRPADVFGRTLAALSARTTWSTHAAKRLMPRRCIPIDHRECMSLVEKDVRPNMKRWNGDLGRSLFHAVSEYRSLPMQEWSERFLLVGSSFRDRTCSCGEADRWGQRFKDGASNLERVLYQCSHCGPVGENDGVLQIGFDGLSAPGGPGESIGVACTVRAPDDEHLYVAVGAVLDCRAARNSVPSDFVEVEVPPGETCRIETSIPVGPDVPPGVYSVWMPAAVNGVLCAESRLVELLPR